MSRNNEDNLHAEVYFLREIYAQIHLEQAGFIPATSNGKKVRIIGKVVDYNLSQELLSIIDPRFEIFTSDADLQILSGQMLHEFESQSHLSQEHVQSTIRVKLHHSFEEVFPTNSLVMVVGTLTVDREDSLESHIPLIIASVVVPCENMDISLWERCVKARRRYFQER